MSVLVTQSFGKENEYLRVIFAVWSYWVQNPVGKVFLFTDNPEYFKPYFDTKSVRYFLLTPQKIKEMRGVIDFLHRMKIALIEEASLTTDENLIYVDSDTFFVDDPTKLASQVSETNAFMHLLEYRFDALSEASEASAHAFLKLISEGSFLDRHGETIPVTPKHYSWNAGVMMLHSSVKRFLPDVYALTDQFFPPTRNHASEQFAFSVVLQNNLNITSCDSVVYHYWYRVKKVVVDTFLKEHINSDWAHLDLKEKHQSVMEWVRILPSFMDNHILSLRDGAIQAFNENRFSTAYRFAFRSLLKDPFNGKFIRDVFYHTRRLVRGQ